MKESFPTISFVLSSCCTEDRTDLGKYRTYSKPHCSPFPEGLGTYIFASFTYVICCVFDFESFQFIKFAFTLISVRKETDCRSFFQAKETVVFSKPNYIFFLGNKTPKLRITPLNQPHSISMTLTLIFISFCLLTCSMYCIIFHIIHVLYSTFST